MNSNIEAGNENMKLKAPAPAAPLPPWLKPVITTTFYTQCDIHPHLTQTNFCKDCISLLCSDCKANHQQHKTLTVYKASKAVAVLSNDVKESLNSSDICDYSINNRDIYFVNKKAQEGRSSKVVGSSYVGECEVCCYRLVKHDRRFCSVECKVAAVEKEMKEQRGGGGDLNTMDEKTGFSASSWGRRGRKQVKPSRAPFF